MRKYVFGTGLLGMISSGLTLIRSLREDRFTWRVALAWANWAITAALVVGTIVDIRRASRGHLIPDDSSVASDQLKLLQKRVRDSR